MGRAESLLTAVGVFCIGWVARGLWPRQSGSWRAGRMSAVSGSAGVTTLLPSIAGMPPMPRGVVHGLMGKLQLDDPYIVTKGVSPSLCIDVGAHLGWTVEQVAVHGHRVYAFEPFAGNHADLEKAMQPYPQVKIFKGAVSNVAGEVSFGGGSTVAQTAENAGEYSKTAFKGTSSNNLISEMAVARKSDPTGWTTR